MEIPAFLVIAFPFDWFLCFVRNASYSKRFFLFDCLNLDLNLI